MLIFININMGAHVTSEHTERHRKITRIGGKGAGPGVTIL
jgi:hypothetical protein